MAHGTYDVDTVRQGDSAATSQRGQWFRCCMCGYDRTDGDELRGRTDSDADKRLLAGQMVLESEGKGGDLTKSTAAPSPGSAASPGSQDEEPDDEPDLGGGGSRLCGCRRRAPGPGEGDQAPRAEWASKTPQAAATPTPAPAAVLAAGDASPLEKSIVAEVRGAFKGGEAGWVTELDARRMLVATEGDDKLARSKLKDAVRWRMSTLEPWLATEGPAEVRIIGLGENHRPIMYHCAAHQRYGDTLAAQWACCWERALRSSRDPMAQFDLILDCHCFQLRLNLTLGQYIKLAPSLDSYFAERLHRLVVLDFPRIAEFLWNGMAPLVPPKTRQKVVFMSRRRPESLQPLYEMCLDDPMRQMLTKLLEMNSAATTTTGREPSHKFTDDFFKWQQSQLFPEG